MMIITLYSQQEKRNFQVVTAESHNLKFRATCVNIRALKNSTVLTHIARNVK